MDRLTDEEWAVQYLEDDAEACSAVNGSHDQTTKDARRMEVLVKRLIRERDDAHRRASQAAPAPSEGLVERLHSIAAGQEAYSEKNLGHLNLAGVLIEPANRIEALTPAPAPSDGLREAAQDFLDRCNSAWAAGEPAHKVSQMLNAADRLRAALSASPAQEVKL